MAYTSLEQFKKDHENTYDEKGNVIQKNGKNVASVNSPYNPTNLGSNTQTKIATAILDPFGMGKKAAQPTPAATTNTIAPKYTAPSNPQGLVTLDQFKNNLANYNTSTNPPAQTNATKPATSSITPPKPTTSANTSKPTDTSNKGLITSLVDQSQARNLELANQAQDIANKAGQKISDIGGQGARGSAGYLTTGTSPVGEGNAAILNQTTAAQQRAVSEGANTQLQGIGYGLNAQGQVQSALTSAAGFTQPTTQFGVLTNPQTGQPVSGNLGNAITMGTNITSIQDGQAKINNLDQQAGGAKNNLQLAISIAKQVPGMNTNAPAINTFKQVYGSNFSTSPQWASFQAQVESVKNAYAAMGIDPGISDWNNISVDALNYLAETLDKNVNNNKQGIQQNISQLQSGLGGGSTGNVAVTGSGSLYDW